MNPETEFGVDQLSFYYEEMLHSNLVELEIETPEGKIILKRSRPEKESQPQGFSNLKRRKTDLLPEKEPVTLSSSLKPVISPIMGVFYRSSSPQSPPFAKEGETVNSGSTLCIVEAMKVMNEIKAETRCKIVKILVENGKPVTKGQDLFHVEPL